MKLPVSLLFASLIPLAACARPADTDNSVDIAAAAQRAEGTVSAYDVANEGKAGHSAEEPLNTSAAAPAAKFPLDPPAPGQPGGLPDDRTPVSEGPFTPDSAQGAANVVQTYYALLEAGKYRSAFALRDMRGSDDADPDSFAADFARFSEYHANIGAPGPVDAGAGQRYVTVPVQIYARLKQGAKPVYEIGSVTLHRTADIDGATAAQRTWRIQAIALKAVPR